MRQFKKRTLALILASTITVIGSFGAENYKNSLMSLEFSNDTSGAVNVKLYTKLNYENNITLQKKDATTYVIMLPETNGQDAQKPELTANIESVDIKTMPYTANNKGYTKITVKTITNIPMIASKALYIPPKVSEKEKTYTPSKESLDKMSNNTVKKELPQNKENQTSVPQPIQNENVNSKPSSDKNSIKRTNYEKNSIQKEPSEQVEKEVVQQNDLETDNSEVTYLIIGALLVIFASVFLFLHGKDRMAQIIGEQGDFSVDDDEDNVKRNRQNIKSTIEKLDKKYRKPTQINHYSEKDALQNISTSNENDVREEEKPESAVIVDLDELYNIKNNEYTNDALDDFLSDFSFEEEEEISHEEELSIDDSLYEKYIENGIMKFSKEDIERINELINIEINDETLKNISDYAVSNPIKKIKPEGLTNLENLVTSYVINQNILFTKEDIDALEKLINVEVDSDFVSDLTTNPERTAQMQQEIEARQVTHKSHEMLTLNVKDVLPDLSEALKKQGGRKIESEVKPQVVYCSEGYDVSTLHIKDELPDITLDLDNPEYKKYRPSDDFEYQDAKYNLSEISVKEDLPDLNDAIANPEKYADKKEIFKADEEELLKNISNVTFKPIYTGEEDIEIINKFEEEKTSESQTVSETTVQEAKNSNNEMNFLSKEDTKQIPGYNIIPSKNSIKSNEVIYRQRTNEKAKELMKIIDNQQKERNIKKVSNVTKNSQTFAQKQKEKESDENEIKDCLVDGKQYNIISTSKLTDKMGCYLAKNGKEFAILGFIGKSIFKIKYYENLNSTRIQARINEKLDENTTQYIIRIGIHKFIVNVTDNNMEYVMDLC